MSAPERAVVIGIGNDFRRDDGAGPEAVRRLAALAPAGVELVISDGEPTRLLEAWAGAATAIVVDAVLADTQTGGTLHRVVVQEPGTRQASPEAAAALGGDSGTASTHGLGLDTAIELSRALDRMPGTLIVHVVEAGDFGQGHGLSASVAAAVDALAAAVLADLGTPAR